MASTDFKPQAPAYTPKRIFILFIHYGDNWIRGSEVCLLNLMANLPAPFTPILWCNQQCLVDTAKLQGIEHAYASDSLGLNWQNLQQAKQLAERFPIMLIHANSAAPVKLASLLARYINVPLLCHLHARYPFYQRWGFGLPWCSALAGVSQAVTAQLQEDGFNPAQVHLIHNGINCSELLTSADSTSNLKQRLGLSPSDFLLVSVGSLIKRKGMDQLLHACATLRLQGIPAHLAIIGEGPERQALENLRHTLQLNQHVSFLGEQPDVVNLISQGADVFVSGAREEVFGLVLAEAGLAKLAVVAPDVGGISEVVSDQISGLLYPSGDMTALNHMLRRCYFSPKLRLALGNQGYQKAIRQFDIHQHCQQMCKLYFQLLSQPTARQAWHSHWPSWHQLNLAANHLINLLERRLPRLGRAA
ncbi:glycosyltransferase [Motilimonas sp. KMU-193]|uniref:glycosyltransferase n=1 Tax=Motilimonas sp. KMU-193 TaxID=3388668 RepID=UPI00396AEFC0